MPVLQVLHIPDERLRKVAKPVEEVNAEIQRIVDDIRNDGVSSVSAWQQHRSIFISASSLLMSLKTATSSWYSLTQSCWKDGETGIEEGCLSIPEQRALVPRAESKIRALDRNGKSLNWKTVNTIQTNMKWITVGKLFIDYLSPLKQQRIRQKVEKTRSPELPELKDKNQRVRLTT